MLIGLTGYAGSGKDTAAWYLTEYYGCERRSFADKLKELVYAQNPLVPSDSGHDYLQPLVDDVGWDAAKRGVPAVRRHLQLAGQAHREVFGEDFWLDWALPFPSHGGRIEHEALYRRQNVVVTDVRYANEAKRVRDLGGVVVRVERPGVGPINAHESERPLESDYILLNNWGVDGLHARIDTMIGELNR